MGWDKRALGRICSRATAARTWSKTNNNPGEQEKNKKGWGDEFVRILVDFLTRPHARHN